MKNMIGQRIKERRKELHISGPDIEKQTGISTGILGEFLGFSVLEKQFLNQFRELPKDDQEDIITLVQLKYNRIQKAKARNTKSSLTKNDNNSSEIA